MNINRHSVHSNFGLLMIGNQILVSPQLTDTDTPPSSHHPVPPTYDFMGNPNPRTVLVVRGMDVTLDCSSDIMAEPNPTYSISTSASGTNVTSIDTTTGIISITNAQSDNDGLYTCDASNSRGGLDGSALQFRVFVGSEFDGHFM